MAAIAPGVPGARNVVLFCDGTSNEFCRDNTNVVKLYQMLERTDPARQIDFYDPGVGTFASPGALLPISKRITRVLGLATGLGLTENIEDGYKYLMNHWRPGDRTYIFGFSRGAYTARAIAAMIHRCGLLESGQEQLVRYASSVFRNVAKENWSISREFNGTFGRPCPIHFLGLWDTVSSVGWAWDPESLPYTKNNPSVQIVRHAIAIDEKRAFFRQNLWGESPDVKQVWFAGVHCDVGGSYPPERSGLSQIALEWMAEEAEKAGLLIDAARRAKILASPKPDHTAPASESLAGWWKLAEYYPKQVRRTIPNTNPPQWETIHRANMSRPRRIQEGAVIHESVMLRKQAVPGYDPAIPKSHSVEPWPRAGAASQPTATGPKTQP